jgi:uncharacterized protein (TIGR03435 family)
LPRECQSTISFNGLDFQLTGGPEWIKSGRFEIQAKSENAASEGQIKLMLQTLLADRFHLQFHRDTKEFSGYALSVAYQPGRAIAVVPVSVPDIIPPR